MGRTSGISYDGGYADDMIAPIEALASIPGELAAVEAGPLLRAGITTFNALRNSGARAGDLVAILGIGGLGHLAVQFARRMGFHTVAIARGKDKEKFALELGAHRYIDSQAQDVAEEFSSRRGQTDPRDRDERRGYDRRHQWARIGGKLLAVGASREPIEVTPVQLINGTKQVAGWPSGTSADSEDTLRFSALTGVKAMIETYPLANAREGYELMLSGKARFRVVLVP
ncbi:MAG: zinc-binding dehydrogenase [Methyloceanibacter sp.]